MRNKSVVITGATGGIGKAIAMMAAGDGARLAISGRDKEKISALKKELLSQGAPEVICSVADMTNESQVSTFFESARQAFGVLDFLINVPGLTIPGRIAEMKVEELNLMLNVNVTAMFLASKHFIATAAPENALIVAIGSIASKRANPNAPGYCAAKAAMTMLAQGMAMQLKERKIRVTTLSPGAVDSAFWGNRAVPREKFMQAADVADVVKFVMTRPASVVIHDIIFESFEMFK